MVTSLFVFFLGLKNASQSKELLKSHRERDVEQESHFEPVLSELQVGGAYKDTHTS
jgi:hypothetical protein